MAKQTSFCPAYGTGQSVSVTTSSSSKTFKAGNKSICLTNTGAVTCYVRVSSDNASATSEDYPVLPSSQVSITIDEAHQYLTAITASGSTTLLFMTGEGI